MTDNKDADMIDKIVEEGLTTIAAIKRIGGDDAERLEEFYLGLVPKLAALSPEQLSFMVLGLFDTGGTLLVRLLEATQ